MLLEHEPAWRRFCQAVTGFLGVAAGRRRRGPGLRGAVLPRARDPGADHGGLGNADIARRLGISEKTVRNHVSRVFDKLGVWTRAQAIVFARDRGFEAGREGPVRP